jgi:allophanate hydrolase
MSEPALPMSIDIVTLHEAYRSGDTTPERVVGGLYTRMAREPLPNAWITRIDEAEACALARALGPFDGRPLYGVPFAVKDNIDVAGLPTTAACPAYAYVPSRSAPTVQALIDAGAICLGKVNMDQFATGLVGTRSPYGACHNVFDPAYLSGGSSSGSAVVVAAHHVSFSLGTDTAGSGRVPAALNNIVGLKPSVGRLSSEGMVPACASLDCTSVFALCVEDAARVRDVMLQTREPFAPRPLAFRYAVPEPLTLDAHGELSFRRALDHLDALGGERVEVDFAPFRELGDLLYGPFVLERLLGVGAFVESRAEDVLSVTRDIILGGRRFDALDCVRAFQRRDALQRTCARSLAAVDVLVTPTVPTHHRIADDQASPRALNDELGLYTRFVNFLGAPVLSVPCDFRGDRLPFGVSFVGAPGRDRALDGLGAAFHRRVDAGMGRERLPLRTPAVETPRPPPIEARLAVVGAHLRGMALNHQLTTVGARYVATVNTAREYRLYALGGEPPRPGLVRCVSGGAAIEIELWDLSFAALGAFMQNVPAPLTIGTLRTEDGESVRGFLCESAAVARARDISEHGGYRAYLRVSG